jgi:hypothetical protein
MLLVLKDDTGTLESHAHMYQLALGGALLSELVLAGAVSIDSDKKQLVRRVSGRTFKDPILAECLQLVESSKKERSAATWVSTFGRIKKLRHRIAKDLCRKGILEDSEDKVLLLFTRQVYPTINPVPERKLVERMREAVLGSSNELDAELVLLIALANASGLLRIRFSKQELKQSKERLEKITQGELVGAATADAVEAAQAMMQMAVMSSIITSTVITSSVTH